MSWVQAVREALRLVVLSLWVCNLLIAVVVLGVSILGHASIDAPGWVGLGAVLTAQVVLPVAMLRRRGGWGPALSVAGLTAAGLALAAPATLTSAQAVSAIPGAPTWWPTQVVITTVLFLVVTHERRGWLLALALVGVNFALRVASWPGDLQVPVSPVAIAAAQAGQLAAMVASAYLAVHVGLAAARETDAARARDRRARLAVGAANARSAQIREADRLVHDQILHGLLAAARDPIPGSPDPAAAAAGSALAVLRRAGPANAARPAGPVGLLDALRELAGRQPVRVRVSGSAPVPLPVEVTEAIVAAAGEALRNVARHARVEQAWVRLEQRLLVTVVTVRDAGCGFRTGEAGDRRGLADSIVRRMADVGGTAQVDSTPGRGTRVTLHWQPPGLWQPDALGIGAAPQFLRRLPLILAPMLLVLLWYAAWLGGSFSAPVPLVAATVSVVLTAAAVARRGMTGRVGPVASATVIAIAWVASAVNGLALDPGMKLGQFYWLSTGAALLPALLGFYRPIREMVIGQVGLILVAGASVAGLTGESRVALVMLPAVLAPLLTMVAAIGVRRLADRLGNDIVHADESVTRRLASLEAAEALHQRLHERLLQRRGELAEFFQEVLDAPSGPRPPELRRRAVELERVAREDLLLGDLMALRAAVAAARAVGWRVVVRCAEGMPRAVEQALVAALAVLPDGPAPLPGPRLPARPPGPDDPAVAGRVVAGRVVAGRTEAMAEDDTGDRATVVAAVPSITITVTAVDGQSTWRASLLLDGVGSAVGTGVPADGTARGTAAPAGACTEAVTCEPVTCEPVTCEPVTCEAGSEAPASRDWPNAWRALGWSVTEIAQIVHARRSLVVPKDDVPAASGTATMGQ